MASEFVDFWSDVVLRWLCVSGRCLFGLCAFVFLVIVCANAWVFCYVC